MNQPANFKNLIGQRFGKLTVLAVAGKRKSGEVKWLCVCDCGNLTASLTSNLKRGISTQCRACANSFKAPVEEYEKRKKNELAKTTDEWEYVRCYDRSKGRYIVKHVCCGKEKKVPSLKNIPKCAHCLREEEKRKKEEERFKDCVQCGKSFKPTRSDALYCCDKCRKKARDTRHIDSVRERWKTNKRLREANAKANSKVDYTISLHKLIERDKRICMLCGRLVNESDYVFVGDTFVAGNYYPSIDHIKPLSKGGTHQWNNVQLAHRLCNSLKNNKEN